MLWTCFSSPFRLYFTADLSSCKLVCNLTKNAPLNSGRSGTKTNSLFVLFKWPRDLGSTKNTNSTSQNTFNTKPGSLSSRRLARLDPRSVIMSPTKVKKKSVKSVIPLSLSNQVKHPPLSSHPSTRIKRFFDFIISRVCGAVASLSLRQNSTFCVSGDTIERWIFCHKWPTGDLTRIDGEQMQIDGDKGG